MRPRQQMPPKPFFYLPLRGRPNLQPPSGHDRFDGETGRLELVLEVVSDFLYVGSGQLDLRHVGGQEIACYAFARRDGQPVIPGTSVKGAVRSLVEAISTSCVRQTTRRERVPRSFDPCRDAARLCPACRIFGTTGYRGRFHFSDATPEGQVQTEVIKIADLWPPRRAEGRKFYKSGGFRRQNLQPAQNYRFIEAVSRGSRFSVALYFENALPQEMALVLHGLGLDRPPQEQRGDIERLPVKLGGAKPRCLGAVRFQPRRLSVLRRGPDLLAALLAGGQEVPPLEAVRRWLATDSLLDRDAWRTFRREAVSTSGTCPTELY